jgi:hypothetical protein
MKDGRKKIRKSLPDTGRCFNDKMLFGVECMSNRAGHGILLCPIRETGASCERPVGAENVVENIRCHGHGNVKVRKSVDEIEPQRAVI